MRRAGSTGLASAIRSGGVHPQERHRRCRSRSPPCAQSLQGGCNRAVGEVHVQHGSVQHGDIPDELTRRVNAGGRFDWHLICASEHRAPFLLKQANEYPRVDAPRPRLLTHDSMAAVPGSPCRDQKLSEPGQEPLGRVDRTCRAAPTARADTSQSRDPRASEPMTARRGWMEQPGHVGSDARKLGATRHRLRCVTHRPRSHSVAEAARLRPIRNPDAR